MKQIFQFLIILAFITSSAYAIKCHQCGGAEKIPKFAKNALAKLNISVDSLYGDCKKTSGSDMCSNGTFCLKRAKVYQIGYSGVNLKWTTYTKGCATLREDNDQIPTNTCYELGQVSNSSGYTAKRMDCYCQKDFCNSTTNLGGSLIMTILFVLSIFVQYSI
ncbi:Protein sleepless [Caenorhabditis elegans]|uniref:Protein sleepless n=1 Tax=Caenorhabditis elegans TaxID=6239 RepID=O45447_CAEEL|nr:Protein sleepless [Caenorhabditis elegans]CAB03061.2 Protein sleepless [Caenorhabditis elegans]|eukprot:NP_496748.2 Downstream of Daf-Nineteen [Caenorhabditis elegans]